MRLMLFNGMVVQVLLYEVLEWGGTVSLGARNEREKIEKMFLRRQLGNILSYHAVRNMCLAHRGTSHVKGIQVYNKSQEYSLIIDCPNKLGI